MTLIATIFIVSSSLGGLGTVSGEVLDAGGGPLAGAHVFAEQGLTGSLQQATTNEAGAFRLEGLSRGRAWIFAQKEGAAFGGERVDLPTDETVARVTIRLGSPETLTGTVVDLRGKPVAGARVTRVALLGDRPVGIPLGKLAVFGYTTPTSDEKGRFEIPALPKGGRVSLKVDHPDYATEGVPDVAVRTRNFRVAMQPGVLIQGTVLSFQSGSPVAGAGVLIRTDRPPGETVVAMTDQAGRFALRIKPGLYVYQAASAEMRSAGLERLEVTGEHPEQRVTLRVSGTGTVSGEVRDAVTRDPVPGAKLVLSSFGNPADIEQTGPSGSFRMQATEGDNTVRIASAPGYVIPEASVQRFEMVAGTSMELPVFWLMPAPAHQMTVLDMDLEPVAGAIVSVIRPQQIGWWIADENGQVALQVASPPADGVVVGIVEHPVKALGAAFALRGAADTDARVVLLPLGELSGRVTNTKKRAVEGATVSAVFAEGPTSDPIVLWRTLSRQGGEFEWPGATPEVSLLCAAEDAEKHSAASARFVVASGSRRDVGLIVIPDGVGAKSAFGDRLPWSSLPSLVAGAREEQASSRPAVVGYCTSSDAPMRIESMANARRALPHMAIEFVVVVDGDFSGEPEGLHILRGVRPAPGDTYVVNQEGKVVFESFGLPPLSVLRSVAGPDEGAAEQ